uniref:Peptidase M14 carboxypeptidase A domain-containing protein n=1 Tax=Meloidogyne javanica TaxID=6303 RepID=A0A915MS58_MELJA
MVAWMRALAKQNPKFVQFISIGKSHEGRGIEGLEIGSRGFRKRAFWIDGGIHAREWAAPHTALYFIHQIRLWRKNRSPTHCVRDQWGRNRCCKGVDLNRNFDFHFKESGSSDDPCSEIYQGKHAFSEPEARAVRDALLSNRYRGRIDGYITLHTYSQIWIHPYGHK